MSAADPLRLLAEVEQALEGATPGPWIVWTAPDVTAVGAGSRRFRGVPSNPTSFPASQTTPADAAATVAAVNAAPKLVAALRREWERHQYDGAGFCAYDGLVWPCVAHRDLTTALGGETDA